ncbi:MAG TPA: right-handed parallel beta-helix repeat-containing protein [Tepidisphaeraceae bacterium]|nr:right-handed parallel beta-helix repeat-containing protein [Tepidisphaeraceae bacterium]
MKHSRDKGHGTRDKGQGTRGQGTRDKGQGKGRTGAMGRAIGAVVEGLEERRLLSGGVATVDVPAQVWVDDVWAFAPGGDVGEAGLSLGDTVEESSGATHTFGVDAYSTIQDGVNFVSDGGIVVVLDGLYTERVSVNRGVAIQGQSEAGVIVQADGGGPVDGHDAFDIDAAGAAVSIEQVTIRNSDWGIRSTAGNVSVSHGSFSQNGFDGTAYSSSITASDAAALFAAHATDGGAIWIVDSTGNDISFNTINSGDRGIVVTRPGQTHIHDNTITSNARGGIALFDGSNNFVDSNDIEFNQGEGLVISGGVNVSATSNRIAGNANAGMVILNPSQVTVGSSQVLNNNLRSFSGDGSTNQWPAAIYASGDSAVGGSFTLRMENNAVTDNSAGGNPDGSVGVYLGSSLRGDGTFVAGHAIAGHTVGLRSSASNVSITTTSILRSTSGILIDGGANVAINNDDFDNGSDAAANQTDLMITAAAGSISSLSGNEFRGKPSGKYIVSLRSQEINGTTSKFKGKLGSAMSSTELNAAEDRINHGLDAGFAGLIRIKAGNVYVTNGSGSIQRGVDVASAGDTVNVKAGTFTEQISIDKSVTVMGAGDSTIVAAPVVLGTLFTTGGGTVDNRPIVYITGADDARVKSLRIDGLGHGDGNFRFEGIAFLNGGGVIDHVTIAGIRDNPMSSEQHGVALYANNTDGVARSIVKSDGLIYDYQKNGMAFNGEGLTATVTGNTVSGAGPTGLLGQNGIQVGFGAKGIISNNIVSGNNFTGTSAGAAGILLFEAAAGSIVTGNTVSGNDIGIYVIDTAGNTDISNNEATGSDYDGIWVEGGDATITQNNVHDNPGSGIGAGTQGRRTVSDNKIHHNDLNGIELFEDVDGSSISNNFITDNHARGIYVDHLASGAASLVVRHNDLRGNSDGGLDNETADRIDARENWWGSASGPRSAENSYNIGSQGSENGTLNDFARWLASGEDTEPAVAGFQPSSATFAPISNDEGEYYSTIQSAIDGTDAGGTITLANGSYNESNILVNKPLTIEGESRDGVIIGPSLADGHIDSAFAGPVSNGFVIQSSDVTIEHLLIDGDADGAIAGDHNFRAGVITDHRTGVVYNNITVQDITVSHTYRRGIQLYSSTGGTKSTGHLISGNTVEDVVLGPGIAVFDTDAIILDNDVFTNGANGFSAIEAVQVSISDGLLVHIDGNRIEGAATGITLVVPAAGSSIGGNNIVTDGTDTVGTIVRNALGTVTINDNDINAGQGAGIWMFGNGNAAQPAIVSNNRITGIKILNTATGANAGIFMSDDGTIFTNGDGDPVPNLASYATITGNTVEGFNNGIVLDSSTRNIAGVMNGNVVVGDVLGSAGAGILLRGSHTTGSLEAGLIRGFVTGVDADVTDLSINAVGIHGNITGVALSGGTAEIVNNHIYDNGTGIRAVGDVHPRIDDNNFDGGPLADAHDNGTDIFIGHDAGAVVSIHGNHFAGDDFFINNQSSLNIDATGNTFDVASNFRVEDLVFHKMDDAAAPSLGLGLVTWVANNLYVTDAGTDHSIQHAIDIASSGNVINVEAGTYLESLIIDKSLKLVGANDGIAGASSVRGAESFIDSLDTAVTITGQGVVAEIDGFKMDGNQVVRFDPLVLDLNGDGIILKFNVMDSTGDAVDISRATNVTLGADWILSGGDAVVGTGIKGDVLMSDNVIDTAGVGARLGGLDGNFGGYRNEIRSPGGTLEAGFLLDTVHGAVDISDNTVSGPAIVGIRVVDDDDDISITGNIITSTAAGSNGIDVSVQRSGAIRKSRSNIQNNRVQVAGNGVVLSDLDADVVVSGNLIDASDTGIRVERVDGDIDLGGPLAGDGDQITARNIGIFVSDVTGSVSARHERLADSSAWGLQVTNYDGNVQISENLVTSTVADSGGIYVSNLARAKVEKSRSNIQNNRVQTQGTGVWLEEAQDDLDVSGNDIRSDAGTGILLLNYSAIGDTVIFNNIIHAARTAIADFDRDGALDITSNTITGGFEAGILVNNSTGGDITINDNHVTTTDASAYTVRAVDHFGNIGMDGNTITAAGDGVSFDSVEGHVVLIGHDFEAVGVAFDARHIDGGVTVKSSTFGHGGGGGGGAGGLAAIWIVDSTGPTLIGGSAPGEGNSFTGVTSAIHIDNVPDVTVSSNTMIEVVLAIAVGKIDGTSSAVISNNTIIGAGADIGEGINVSGLDSAVITGNSVTHVETGFVVNSHTGPFDVSFTDNSAGFVVKGYTVNARSDTMLLDFVHGNSVHDAVDGVVMGGEFLSIVGNTIADMDMDGISGKFIILEDGALRGEKLDATQATLNDKIGSAKSVAENFADEDKITHATDDSSLGFVRVQAGNVFVTQNSGSIQRGVDAGSDGDTVNVNQGSFAGGVSVSKHAVLGYGMVVVTGDDFADGTAAGGFQITGGDVTIDNFRLVGGGSAGLRKYGMFLSDGGSNYFIQNNHTNGFDTAIFVPQAPPGTHHLRISNNVLDLTGGSTGIELHSVSDAVIQENEMGFGHDLLVVAGSNNISAVSNVLHGASGNAIYLFGGNDGVVISANEITDGLGDAIALAGNGGGDAHVSILNNTLHRNVRGISGGVGAVVSSMEVRTNSIVDNAVAGIQNDSGGVIDASGNWWGSVNGPDSPLNGWGGTPKGDRVIGSNVNIAPWLGDGIDASADRGFQHAPPADTTAPTVSAPDLTAASDSGASDHDDITNDSTPTFVGTAEPGATVQLVEGSTDLGSTFADAGGQWTITSHELSPGTHIIEVYAVDTFGNRGSAADDLTVYIDTAIPIADAGVDQVVREADLVTLTGGFTDTGGFGPYSFEWTQTSGPFVFTTQTGNLLRFTPPDDGIYVFQLTVTDAAGNRGSDSVSVTAQNVNPVVTAVDLDHTTIDENGDVVVAGSFTDAGSLDTHTVTINWGDGNTGLAVVNPVDRTFTATHRYLDDNPSGTPSDVYTISVTVEDDDHGVSAAVTRTATVDNKPPDISINGAPSTNSEGTFISLTSTLIDPGTLDTFIYAWSVTKNGALYASGSAGSFSFTPNDDATYVVTLTVTDDDGGVGTDTKTITVTDIEPTISVWGDPHVNESALCTINLGAVTDPGNDTVINYYVNWGDSSPLEVFSTPGPKTHVYAEGPATRTIVVSLEDENGIHPNAGSVTFTVDNVPPTAVFSNFGAVNEGSSGFVMFTSGSDVSAGDQSAGFKYSYDFNNDGVFETGNGTYAGSVVSTSATVPAAFLADGPGTRTIRGRISDRDGGFTDYLTTITINNVTPIVNAGPDSSVGVNAFFTQSGSFTDPGADSPWQVFVNYTYDPVSNPGQGLLSQTGSSKTFVLSHFYSVPGTYTARVTVIDKDGASSFDDITVTVANTRFQVLSFTPTVSGFDVRFNRAANAAQLNLYDGLDAAVDPSDVSFFGTATGQVRGSLMWDFQSNVLHFVKTGGALAADNYTVGLQSRVDGFADTTGEMLDGNFDDVAGGDYSTGFTVAPTSDRLVSLPDFARGQGQTVNIPATGTGIPVRIDNASGVNAVDLDVVYDGFLLNITGATLAPGMPADWSITTNLVTNGIFKMTISGVSTLPAGARDLIILSASVPTNAAYGNSEVIRIQNLSINGGFIGSRADTAVHKATFFGDASSNGGLDGFDSSLISRVVVHLDNGFDKAGMTDPTIVADVNSNGVIDGLDASWVAQKSLFAPLRPEIPNLPAAPVSLFSGVDPTFALPEHAAVSAGGSVLVPLSVTDSAEGLIGFNINVDYTTTLLDIASGVASEDVSMGSLFSSADGWSLVSYVDDASGSIRLAFFNTTPMTGGTGSIAEIRFHVPLSTPVGTTPLDLNGAAGSELGLIYNYVDGSIDINAATSLITGTDGDDSYYVRRNAASDMIEVYSGTSAAGTLIYSAPEASLTSLTFDTGAGNDQLIVDSVNGTPLPYGGIVYDAGADTDSLQLIGNGSGTGVYEPSTTAGSGSLAISSSAIAFSGVEPITASQLATLRMVTPSAGDVLLIDKPAPAQNRISGFSGGTAISPLTFFDVGVVVVNTSANDSGGDADAITISVDGMVATGLTTFAVDAGSGPNTLNIHGGMTTLAAINGAELEVTADNAATVDLVANPTLQSLNVTDTARVNLLSGGAILHVGSLSIGANAMVDLTDGRLELAPADASIFTTIRSYIRSARNTGPGGLWSGNGLGSSFVAADSGRLALASVLNGGEILVRPALVGDLNLDNQVTISDFIDLASNFNSSGTWVNGDLNYDDVISISDFIDLASNFNQVFTPAAPAFAAASEAIVTAPQGEAAAIASSTQTAPTKKSSTPARGVKKTHSRRAVRHHRPGKARPGISRHE